MGTGPAGRVVWSSTEHLEERKPSTAVSTEKGQRSHEIQHPRMLTNDVPQNEQYNSLLSDACLRCVMNTAIGQNLPSNLVNLEFFF